MDFKQSTIGEIIDSEREMVLRGKERFGAYFTNASEFSHLLAQFILTADPDRLVFVMFLSQLRKHHALALFSTVRLHRIQAMMDLRQLLKAGSCAAYAIAHTNREAFADVDENNIMNPSQHLATKRYRWLEQNYPAGSQASKNIKGLINESTAHSNIVYAHNNFHFDPDQKRFETPFFDIEDEYFVKTDLWLIAKVAMGLMDLFYGINANFNVIKFADDFVPRLATLRAENDRLKKEMMATERYRRADELAKKARATTTSKGHTS